MSWPLIAILSGEDDMDREQLPKDSLLSRLRAKHAGSTTQDAELMAAAADCIEQLQMPPAKVRELAQTEDGADSLALIRALSMQIEGQRKHIATLQAQIKSLGGGYTKVSQ